MVLQMFIFLFLVLYFSGEHPEHPECPVCTRKTVSLRLPAGRKTIVFLDVFYAFSRRSAFFGGYVYV